MITKSLIASAFLQTDDQVNEDKMDRACSTHGRDEKWMLGFDLRARRG
jgi:hypothetical protein